MNEFNGTLEGAKAKPRPHVREANEKSLDALCTVLDGYVPPNGEHTGPTPEEKWQAMRQRQQAGKMNTQPTHPIHRPAPAPSATGGLIGSVEQNKPRQKSSLIPAPTPKVVSVPRTAPLVKKKLPPRIFTTGRLRAGKDTFMELFGYEIFAFADPLYALQEFFFGTKDKSLPGARKFLQQVGQWGRGITSEEYPLTIQRAMFTKMIHTLGNGKALPPLDVVWEDFGKKESIWVDALISRVKDIMLPRVGVSGCRFENEFKALQAAGFKHYHVMCSPQTWIARLKKSGLEPNAPVLRDLSEQMASSLDANVYETVRREPVGKKLAVIWSDDDVKSPSDRFYSLDELE